MSKPKLTTLCAECPARNADKWRLRGAVLRTELRRHDLTFRELQIAELILDKSFGWQRVEVIIPQLRFFKELTGISESDTVKVLKTLHARRIVSITHPGGRPTYKLNEDAEQWKAMPRVSKETMQESLNLLRENNGLQPVRIERDAEQSFFRVEPGAKNFGAAIGQAPIGQPISSPTGEFPNLF